MRALHLVEGAPHQAFSRYPWHVRLKINPAVQAERSRLCCRPPAEVAIGYPWREPCPCAIAAGR
jgi:hypothetical protein